MARGLGANDFGLALLVFVFEKKKFEKVVFVFKCQCDILNAKPKAIRLQISAEYEVLNNVGQKKGKILPFFC